MLYKILVTLTLFQFSFSNTFFVPDDFDSIQGAIDASENGDTIFVDSGI